MAILLDTDVFIDLLRKRTEAENWIAGLSEPPFLSGVTALEVAFGALSARELREVRSLIGTFDVMWPEANDTVYAIDHLATLRLAHGIGALDAVTGAIALRHNLSLATFNIKHFRAIPGLSIVQPYTRS